MRFIDRIFAPDAAWIDALQVGEQALRPAIWLISGGSMLVLLISAEALAWDVRVPGGFILLRSLHLLSGLVVTLGCLYRTVIWSYGVIGGAVAIWRRRPFGRIPRIGGLRLWTTGIVFYWLSLWVLILSGLEVYMAQRYNASFLPWGSRLTWQLTHQIAMPYFFAFFLLLGYFRLRDALLRLRDYLVSP